MKKRMLALFLCLTMIFSMLPGQALAEGEEPGETQPQVTEPAATEPAETDPEITEPETTVPEVTEPEATEPEEMEPEEPAPQDEPSAQSDLPGGSCDYSLTWTFDEASGVLAISGSGRMKNYSSGYPWKQYVPYIQQVTVSEGIRQLGEYAFEDCVKLTSVSLPSTLETWDSTVFDGCTSLAEVNIAEGNSNYSSQDGIVYSADGAVLVYYPIGRTETTFTIPSFVAEIGEYAFEGVQTLAEVIIPENVTTINSYAFSLCAALKSVKVLAPVETIGYRTFFSCNALESVTFSEGTTTLEDSAFYFSSSNLKNVTFPGTLVNFSYLSFDCATNNNASSTNYCKKVTSAGPIGSGCDFEFGWTGELPTYAFDLFPELEKIIIPDTITAMDGYSMRHHLTKITSAGPIGSDCALEYGWTADIPGYAFPYGVQEVYLPVTVTSISANASVGCKLLTDVYYDGTKAQWEEIIIDETGNSYLLNATIHCLGDAEPELLTGECGYSATWTFDKSTGLLTISGSGSIFDFGRLTDSQGIETGEIRDTPWKSFLNEIISVRIEEGITYIGNEAFKNASNLVSVYAPTVISVGERAFYKAANLATADIPVLRSIDESGFSGCKTLTSLPLPDNFSWFKDYAFQGCGFTEFSLPGKVTSLPFLFEGCADLKAVFIPSSVNMIGNTTFRNCTSLTDIYYEGSQEDWAAIYYPIKSPDEYNNATIHYNCSQLGPNISREVRYFLDWEEQTQRAFFGPDGLVADSCAVSEETDSTFLEDPASYEGLYVLVETKLVDDEEILLSVTLPQSNTGTVTACSESSITIDDIIYSIGETVLPETILGEFVLYHIVSNELVGIEVLQEKSGYLTYWHEDAKMMWIQSDETATDSKDYRLSIWATEDSETFLNEFVPTNCKVLLPVKYLMDSSRHIFEITLYTDMIHRTNGFSESEHGWPIVNSRTSFGYPTGYAIEPWIYYVHGQSIRSVVNENLNSLMKIAWNGNCFGLSMLAVAQYTKTLDLSQYFTQNSGDLNTFGYNSIQNPGTGDRCVLYNNESGRVEYNTALIQKIEQAQVSFYSSALQGVKEELHYRDFQAFIDYLQGDNPVPLVIGLTYFQHAVVTDTSKKPIYIGNNQYLVPLYDSNAPQAPIDMSNPWEPYTYNQSMLYLDLENGYYGYWYNDAFYEKDGYGLITSHGDYKLEIFNIAALDQSFFDSQYSFDSEYLTCIYGVCGTMEIIKVDSSTGEHTTVFKSVAGIITTANVEELFNNYENTENDSTMYKGGLRLPLGNYIIRTDGKAYIQCMYDNDIFVLGADDRIEALLEMPKDKLTIVGTQDDTAVACVHASSEIDFCTSLESTINTRETVTLSANSETRSASVVTNAPAGSITLQHAVDGELIDITSDMIHQHTDLIHNEAVEATCTVSGQAEHYLCPCGMTFTDEDAYEEITDVVIPALGHVGQWAPTGDAEGEEFRICERCGEKEIRMTGSLLVMDPETLGDHTSVWIDGLIYPVRSENGKAIIQLPEGDAFYMQTYTFHIGDKTDVHTQYPTGMQVWKVEKNTEGIFAAERIEELDNLLQYSGASIRIVGVKGIRMITSITKGNKSALTGEGLAGYTLEEYGTALCWATDLAPGEDLVLGKEYTRSNYAYKKGVADPIFAQTADLIQYTNVLVGFDDDQCIPDIVMRPYIILSDAEGNQVTLYGGSIHRSIGYIAYQNRNVFKPGSASYDYVWGIIHHVYGDRFDEDYQG